MTQQKATLPLPDFQNINLNQLKEHVEQKIKESENYLNQLQHTPENFEDQLAVIRTMDIIANEIDESWGIICHLNGVMNTPEIREVYQSILPIMSQYYTRIGQHTVLYQTYLNSYSNPKFKTLSEAQQSSINLTIKSFELSGVALEGQQKERYAEISARLSQLSSDFSNHVLDATQAYKKSLTTEQLKGLPQDSIDLLYQYGKQHQLEQPVATLDFPSYLAIMTYADDRSLREEIYKAFTTRASDQSENKEFDNTLIMEEILKLRQEKAQLLGFKNFAEFSLSRKMAPNVQTVHDFLGNLAQHAKTPAQQEVADLKEIADVDTLQPWDSAYYAEKLKQKQFNLSQEELKPYFPAPKVVSGLFEIVKRLYNIDIVEKIAAVWQQDVKYYEIEDQGKVIAGFYLDLYARSGKRGGAWMNGFRSRMSINNELQLPICYMVCNFTPPLNNQPSLLTHDEALTLFHEFGHGLHHMLTEIDDISVAGTNGVAWDAVELPSQFMEFWTWDKEALDLISEHIQTKEPLPENLLKALLDARFFQSGMQTLRQLEFALFDFKIHDAETPLTAEDIQNTLNQVREEISVIPTTSYNRFQHGFSHIFAGGYAAGYYSYKWAEVLASDAFDRFEQEGIFNTQTGEEFRKSILAVGGKDTALDAFVNFRGREPKIDALLRHQGWTPAIKNT